MTIEQAEQARKLVDSRNMDLSRYKIDIEQVEGDILQDLLAKVTYGKGTQMPPIIVSSQSNNPLDKETARLLACSLVDMTSTREQCNFRLYDSTKEKELIPFNKIYNPSALSISITITTEDKFEEDKGRFFNFNQTNIFIISE